MFELNTYMIGKIGWTKYSKVRGIKLHFQSPTYTLFEDDPLVMFFVTVPDRNVCFVIKELVAKRKQISKNVYKFIICYCDSDQPRFVVEEFSSNHELFKLIIKNEACNSEYQRYFRINKLISK